MAAEAERLLQTGQTDAAFDTLDAAVDAFWAKAPLTVVNAYIVAEGSASSPSRPLLNPMFAPGQRVAVYVEPLGYLFDRNGDEFRIGLRTGIEIQTRGGLILAKSDDFGRLEWTGPVKNRAFAGRIAIDMPMLKSGDYQLLLTITDDASQKSAEVTLPFKVTGQ